VIAVVREDAHAPVVRHLPDANQADLREELRVRPTQLEVAPRVAQIVARVVIGRDVVRRVAEDVILEQVELHDDLQPIAILQTRREAHPLREEPLLPERIADRARVRVERRRRHIHRERALPLRAKLHLAVNLDREAVLLRLLLLHAARVEDEPVEIFGHRLG
jgi:hypothetical protein